MTEEPVEGEESTPNASPSPGGGLQAVDDEGWTATRLRVREWLVEKAPHLAPVYEAAVQMAADTRFPGRVWFMAHALRDIRNRLPDAIAGAIKRSSTQYADLADRVTATWLADGLPGDGSSPVTASAEAPREGPARLEVSATLVAAVGELVSGHLAIKPRKEEAARRLWDAIGGQPAPDYAVRGWLDATNQIEKFAHLRSKPLTAQDEEKFARAFDACERALVVMASRSYENMDDIDAILASTNR